MTPDEDYELRRSDVQTFWSRPIDEAALRRAEDKYQRMTEVAALPRDDPRRIGAIRALARDFPGSLREAELSSPEACEQRRQTALRRESTTRWAWCGVERSDVEAPSTVVLAIPPELTLAGGGPVTDRRVAPSTSHSAAPRLDASAVAVTLWSELHVAIADLLDARRRHRTGAGMREFLASMDGDVAARWPVGGTRRMFVDLPLRPRTAYLWLAWQAGLDVVSLHRVLFTRVGSWALRADDPPWAHPAAVLGVLLPP